MNDETANTIRAFLAPRLVGRSADLGSYNLNGAVKDIVPSAIGFDITPGPGVDVVIVCGHIPREWQGQFDTVFSVGSFQFCPDSEAYLSEIVQLLRPGGVFLLTMCSPRCHDAHNTNPAHVGIPETRYTLPQLAPLIEGAGLTIDTVKEVGISLIVEGAKPCQP